MPRLLSKINRSKRAEKKKLKNADRKKYHKSFKRSFREDYLRETNTPGLMASAAESFKMIFSHKKLFIPFTIIMVLAFIVLVGLMSQDTYKSFQDALDNTNKSLVNGELGNFGKAGLMLIGTITTGGLNQAMDDVGKVFMVFLFIIIWLVTIYLTRHILAGHKVKLRDGLYNALTPIISTLLVLGVIFIEAIPIMIVVVTYNAAVATEFLNTPFYAFIYFIFAFLLCLLSGYLIVSSFMALVAVSAPGLYPMTAINTATDLVAGRRIKLTLRLVYLILVIAVCFIIVMLPIILLDTWLKSCFSWLSVVPAVPFFLLVMTVFSFEYTAVYSYLYYRKLLALDK